MEKKTKIIATVGVIAVVAFFGYKWYSKRKNKKVLASKPVTTPTKTAGADGDDDDSNASGVPRRYVAPSPTGRSTKEYRAYMKANPIATKRWAT